MKYKQNARYLTFVNKNDFRYFFIKEGSRIKFYVGRGGFVEEIPLQEAYYDVKLLMTSGNKDINSRVYYSSRRCENEACYLLLKKGNGKGVIMELLEGKILLEGINWGNFKAGSRIVDQKDDVVIRVWDKQKCEFSLYSLLEGFIFGPYRYSTIIEYGCCVVMDENLYVDDDGWTTDLSSYKIDYLETDCEDIMMYSNKEKNSYYIFLNRLNWLWEDEDNENIRVFENDQYIFRYNKLKNELKIDRVESDSLFGEWTYDSLNDAADIAYEGYSRLELGLED